MKDLKHKLDIQLFADALANTGLTPPAEPVVDKSSYTQEQLDKSAEACASHASDKANRIIMELIK